MNTANNVRMIPTKTRLPYYDAAQSLVKLRVAAYARVSTDNEEQLSSYEAQVDHYTRHIQGNPEWEFVKVYTDEGISATSTKKRGGFNEMVQDALAGKLDLIITKSISRFARNTVDSLTTIRMLKDKGIGIFFEKENINTLDAKGELLITIMSSVAQEESRSISENVSWGIRKRFSYGKFSLPYKQFLGYEKGPDGKPMIVESEAKIVRQIYRSFLDGMTPSGIAKQLTKRGIPSPGGKKLWRAATVESILTNEKYKGDALLQKKYTASFLTKEMKKNEGEIPQYYVDNCHPAIIAPDIFDLVQSELPKRRQEGRVPCGDNVFSGRVFCGACGKRLSRKHWHTSDKYAKHVWICLDGYKHRCPTKRVDELELKAAFVKVFNGMIENSTELVHVLKEQVALITDTAPIAVKIDRLNTERVGIQKRMDELVNDRARAAITHAAFEKQYKPLAKQNDRVVSELESLEFELIGRRNRRVRLEQFIDALGGEVLTEFDEEIWLAMVQSVTVQVDGGLAFRFVDGSEITERGYVPNGNCGSFS